MANSKNDGGKLTPRPLPPPPPGERPPVYSKAEMDAHFEYQRIQIAKMEANFTMEDLETILKEVKAPSLKGASQVNHILLNVSALKASNDAGMAPQAKKLIADAAKRKKEWAGITKYIATIKDAQNWHIAWLADRPYYDPEEENRNDRKAFVATLEAAENALNALAPRLFITQQRARGQHPPAFLKNPYVATDIFIRLARGWEEIGFKNISAAKRYEIVQRCMAKAGENVSVDAIKKAITKHLNPKRHKSRE